MSDSASSSSSSISSALPYDLYPYITRYIDTKDDLITLAAVSLQWRMEAESILWETTTLNYDDPDEDNIGKLEFLIDRGATYIRHLDLDYAYSENAHRNETVERSEPFFKAVRAISLMDHLERVDIYCNGDMAAILLNPDTSPPSSPSFPSFQTIHTIKYLGSCSPPLYRFLRQCTNLESLRFSNNLEPTADYSLLYYHSLSESTGAWNALTTFSGNVFHIAAILRSPIAGRRIKNLTIHLQPYAVDIKTGWADVSIAPGVESLGLGDLSGYPPFVLEHVLRDLSDALPHFPNVKEVKRAPFYERVNRAQLLQTLSTVPDLTYLSLLDYEPNFVPTRGLTLAKELPAPNLETVVCIACPNRPTAVMFRSNKGVEGIPGPPGKRHHWKEKQFEIDEEADI